jgi:hypothetical protein
MLLFCIEFVRIIKGYRINAQGIYMSKVQTISRKKHAGDGDFHKRHAQGRALRRQTGGGPVPARAPIGAGIYSMFFPPGQGVLRSILL